MLKRGEADVICLLQGELAEEVRAAHPHRASRFERRTSDDEMAAMLDANRMTSLVGLPT